MEITTIKTSWGEGELKQNTHVIIGENTCVVIDAGSPLSEVEKLTDKPIEAVFITHGHFDHVEHIEEFDKLNVPIYASEQTADFLFDEILNVSGNKTYQVKNLVPVLDNEEIECSVGTIKCLYTPGHSEDSMCYLLQGEENILFSGDTVFSVAVGSIELPTGDKVKLISSLDRILKTKFNTMYTGHGKVSSKNEQLTNIPIWKSYLTNQKDKIGFYNFSER
jgi:glyoxylase-like metal-dependent hydrolase (beta-lactamase superfamily II)